MKDLEEGGEEERQLRRRMVEWSSLRISRVKLDLFEKASMLVEMFSRSLFWRKNSEESFDLMKMLSNFKRCFGFFLEETTGWRS